MDGYRCKQPTLWSWSCGCRMWKDYVCITIFSPKWSEQQRKWWHICKYMRKYLDNSDIYRIFAPFSPGSPWSNSNYQVFFAHKWTLNITRISIKALILQLFVASLRPLSQIQAPLYPKSQIIALLRQLFTIVDSLRRQSQGTASWFRRCLIIWEQL